MNWKILMAFSFLILCVSIGQLGCDSDGESSGDADADSDTDSDADTDADSDTDLDSDSDSDSDSSDDDDEVDDGFEIEAEISSAIGTVGIVTWSIDKDSIEEAHIEFGPDTDYGMEAPVDLGEQGHRTLLLGMKGSSTYHFRVVASDGATTYVSGDRTIETGPVTNLVHVDDRTIDNASSLAGGFIVTSLFQAMSSTTGASLAFIIDADGDVVWWYESQLNDVTRARMSYDGKNMWMAPSKNGGSMALERVSMDGLDAEKFDGWDITHDITPVTGDIMAFPDGECAIITEVDSSGNFEAVFDTNEIWSGTCHPNAIRYSETEGAYTLSDRAQGDIVKIDRETRTLVWRLSDFGIDWGADQHGHHLLDDSIVLFNNTDGSTPEFAIDESTMQGNEIWNYKTEYNTMVLGDVQRLQNGNTLVNYCGAAIIHEVDLEGNRVQELVFDGALGFSSWRETLYGPPSDVQL